MVKNLIKAFIPLLLLIIIYIFLSQNKTSTPQGKTHLVVYTYSSFASSWGPAPILKKMYEEKTGNTMEFIDVGEAGIIMQRLALEKENTQADLVLGLDQFQLNDEKIKSFFYELPKFNLNLDESAPQEKIQIASFLGYNWSPMTFIYRKSDNKILPKKLEDFNSKDLKAKIIILDPRSSSPGYIFLHWALQKLGKEKILDFFNGLKKNVYNVTPSWSSGYGLFKKKQAHYVFSYLTSPAYHWIEEKDFDYQPLYLDEELPYHIEYAGILNTSVHKEAALEFFKFILEPESQKIIMTKNYMLPVIAGVKKGTEFENLQNIKLFEPSSDISREEVLSVWKSIKW